MTHDEKKGQAVDVGCGTDPVLGCAAYVDAFPDEAISRAAGVVRDDLPNFHKASIEALPFTDKQFDYSYARHILEHVEDPTKACQELMRISKGGYIETPSYFNEVLFGKEYHGWLVFYDDREKVLRFYKKRPFEDRAFGKMFVNILEQSAFGRSLHQKNNALFINGFEWRDSFNFEVIS